MIGLATPFLVNNYGTKLQAYAMQTIINDLHFDNEIIRYGFLDAVNPVKNLLFGGGLTYRMHHNRKQKQIEADPAIQSGMKFRNQAFQEFTSTRYHFSQPYATMRDLAGDIGKYKAVVCGSDQIWLPSHIIRDYYTLRFVPDSVRKIAYAPSFGIGKIPGMLKSDYKRFLNRFDVLTAREARGAEMIHELTGRDCPVVLDPTLLLTAEQWNRHMNTSTSIVDRPYVFTYFLGTNEEHRKLAKEVAAKNGCILITIPHVSHVVPADTLYADQALYAVTPPLFLNLIRHAQTVLTDSFHGSVFSLLFQKDLYVLERFASDARSSTNNRLYSLLQMLGLEHRMIKEPFDLHSLSVPPIPYKKISAVMENKRRESTDVLKKVLI